MADARDYDDYKAHLIQSGANPQDVEAYVAHLKELSAKNGGQLPQEVKATQGLHETQQREGDIGRAGADVIARTLDYGGGIARTGLGLLASTAAPGEGLGTSDVMNALRGKAPHGEEILGKLGMPENKDSFDGTMSDPQTYVNPVGSVAARFLQSRKGLGMAMDVGTDPLTYGSFGAVPAARALSKVVDASKAAKAMKYAEMVDSLARFGQKGVSEGLDKVGTSTYKSGLKKIDQEVAKYGKKPVSDLLMEREFAGNSTSAQAEMDDMAKLFKARRDDILQVATRTDGSAASMADAMRPTEDFIAQIRSNKDPKLQSLADSLEAEVAKYKKLDPKKSESVIRELPRTEMMGGNTPITKTGNNPGGWAELQPPKIETDVVGGHTPIRQTNVAPTEVMAQDAATVWKEGGGHTPVDFTKQGGVTAPAAPERRVNAYGVEMQPKPSGAATVAPESLQARPGAEVPDMLLPYKEERPWLAPGRTPNKYEAMAEVPGVGVNREVAQPILAPGKTKGKFTPGATVPDRPMPMEPLPFNDMTDPTRGKWSKGDNQWGTFVDNSGVSPKQASGYKTTAYADVPESAWREKGFAEAANQGNKKLSGGLREATEQAVGRSLGEPAEAALRYNNDALGRVLTSQEVAERMALQEQMKNGITSVDGAMLFHNPLMFAGKKMADIAKLSGTRTYAGRAMKRLAQDGHLAIDPALKSLVRESAPQDDALENYGESIYKRLSPEQ